MTDRWYNRRNDAAPFSPRNSASPFAFFGQAPFTSAMAHVFFAAFYMSNMPHWWGVWWSMAIIVVVTAWKEFWLDRQDFFEGDSWVGGAADFGEYVGGMLLGLFLFYLRGGA